MFTEGKLPRQFYTRDPQTVARELLGKYLVHQAQGGTLVAEITETEAYLGVGDRGSHSCSGVPTPRTQVQYGVGGHAYLYLIYGMYTLFNVVTGDCGDPGCVLVRGARPVEGQEAMARLRYQKGLSELSRAQLHNFLNGPGKFCRGMALTRAHNGADLCGDSLYFCGRQANRELAIGVGKRINIDYAGEDADLPLRFFLMEQER